MYFPATFSWTSPLSDRKVPIQVVKRDTPLLTVILVSHAYISLFRYQGYFDLLPLLSVTILVFSFSEQKYLANN